ncbi:MAG: hypothetical protein ACTHMR_01935 [Thermomicrobiales bacterium]
MATAGDRWGSAVLLTIAAVALGGALQSNDGRLSDRAIFFVTVALIACGGALVLPPVKLFAMRGEALFRAALNVGLLIELAQFVTKPPAYGVPTDASRFKNWFLVLAIVGVLALFPLRHRGLIWFGVLLVLFLWLGVWILIHLPHPDIDVYMFQWEGAEALLRGHNPYTIRFLNMYGPGLGYYAPRLEDGAWLTFGFPYPPLSLFAVLPGMIFNDFRFAQLVAFALTAVLLTRTATGTLGIATAALYLFTPRGFLVLNQGWTEPFVVLLLAATVVCALRAPRWVWLPLGLWLATKQYLVVAVPLTVLLLPRPWSWRDLWRLWWRAGAVALAVSLPLALWNLPAFVRSVITLQLYQPFRPDALSYVAWFARNAASHPPTWLALPAVVPAIALALWRAARTPAGFATAVAFVFLVFLVTNKQAFCNYYFFVIGALCCAIAATQPASKESGMEGDSA